MDDKNKQELLCTMAKLCLEFCRGEVKSITVHADVEDDDPYTSVRVWGDNPNEPIYEWFEFPKEG